MKKFRNTKIFGLFLLLLMIGCVSQTAKDKIHRGAVINDSFTQKMDRGETTREQEQKHIRAMRVWHYALDYNVNGNEPPADVKLIVLEEEKTSE